MYTAGDSFPNYINAVYCTDRDQWRVTYSLYYQHDGALSEGHKHDWESATVVWGRRADKADWWHREQLVLSQHGGSKTFKWEDTQNVNDATDQDESTGKYRRHPKVYVGFFKHANFPNKKTNINVFSAVSPQDEFRSRDWYYMPNMGDMRPASDISASWNYGDATSTPAKINPCSI